MALLELEGYTVNVVMLSMANGVYEEINKNRDGSYTVFLNSKYNNETLRDALTHAIEHIRRRDWDQEDVQQIEAEAHSNHAASLPMPIEESKYTDIIERLRKERKAIRKKVEKYQKKYAGMTEYEIMQHNERMLAIAHR